MQTPYDTRLPAHLAALKQEIEGYARDFGLDFYETIFEVIDAEDLNEIAAYGGFPTRYPHWSFGMSYEELKKGYDYGLSKIYEMVINNDPCYAYLMRSNHIMDQKLVMAHVYGHCLAPETRVETRDGVKAIPDIAVGDLVLTHRGVYRPVTAVARRWHDGDIHTMRVGGSSQEVRITSEHPVLAVRGSACTLAGRSSVPCRPTCQIQHKCAGPRPHESYRREWLPAKELKVGDWVVFPRRKPNPEFAPPAIEIPFDKILHRQRRRGSHILPVDRDLARFLGYFIAEGNAQPRGLVGFGFHRDEAEFQDEVAALSAKLFGARVGKDRSATALATTVRFNNLEIARWLRANIGTNADRKRVPDFLMESQDDALQLAWLSTLFNGDGTFTRAAGRDSGSLSITTISERLAHQVRHASARLGMKVALYARTRQKRRTAYDLVWTGGSAHVLSKAMLGQDVLAGNRSFERAWVEEDVLYRPIRGIETGAYSGYVYNFSVEEDESYTLSAGFVVHNCDFFKNNAYFGHTSRKMMDEMANHGARIRSYVERYGEDEVEAFMDKCMSIDDLIDVHSVAIRRREEASRYDFAPEEEKDVQATRFRSKDYMDEYINPRDVLKAEEEKRRKEMETAAKAFPETPQKDILLFLIEHAPLKNWQRDMLSIIRDEAYYFAPQGMTKVANEGWACLSKNAYVFTSRGVLPMGRIVEEREELAVGDGATPRRVYDWATFTDRETVKVRTKRGLELEGSTNHRVMLAGGEWKRLDELALREKVRIGHGSDLWASDVVRLHWKAALPASLASSQGEFWPLAESDSLLQGGNNVLLAGTKPRTGKRRRIHFRVPQVVDEKLGAFLGYLLGDGHISDVKRTIGLTTGDESQAEHFIQLTEELFGLRAVKKWAQTKWRVRFSSRNVQEFLVHLGLKTGRCARQKTVPDCILRSPKRVVVAFLRALYDCDGYGGKSGVILASSSPKMGEVVQLLLLNFGILSKRIPKKDGCWHIHTLGLSAKAFLERIGFGLARKQDALCAYIDGHRWFKEQPWEDEIVSLEHGRADVYDISVEQTHRYAAQGFINHNSYWHSTIMTQKALSPSELLDYADHHSGTMAMSGGRLNPYKLGIELLRDIEFRWNTGRFGKEWEECEDTEKKRTWDKQLGLGRQKIFEVRKIHSDITLIDTFLTPEFCVQHGFFSYAWQEQAGQYFIESRDFQQVKQRLLFSLTNFGKPWIYVIDGNHRNRGELLLKHQHNGVELKMDQAADTIANIQSVWSRPVHLSTLVDGKPTILTFDGTEHSIRSGGEGDDTRKPAAGKTR